MVRVVIVFMVLFVSCKSPSQSEGMEYSSIYSYGTVDYCRGIDVHDDMLVAASSGNGYMRFRINNDYSLDSLYFSEINQSAGDDQAYSVLLSKNDTYLGLVLDDIDGISYEFFNEDGTHNDAWALTQVGTCANTNLFRSMAIDDSESGEIKLFTLQKHVAPDGVQCDALSEVDCLLYPMSCEWDSDDGECDVQTNFNDTVQPNSTSVGVFTIETSQAFGGFLANSGCNVSFESNQDLDIQPMDLYYSDGFISVSDGPEVKVFELDSNDDLSLAHSFHKQGGHAQSVFSLGNSFFGGFDNDKGCYMVLLDLTSEDISEINNLSFAEGYSITSIHYDSNMLALGTGSDDKVLLYSWVPGTTSISSMGVVDVGGYIYDVKLQDGILYVASREGINIYEIEG